MIFGFIWEWHNWTHPKYSIRIAFMATLKQGIVHCSFSMASSFIADVYLLLLQSTCDFWHSETEINLIHVQNLQLTLLRICFISIISFKTIYITKMVIFILFSSCVLENWWRQNLKGNHFCKSESQPQNYRCLTFCTMHCNNSAILSSTMYSSFVDPWI